MLTNDEFQEYCQKRNLSSEAQNILHGIRSSEPSRRVESGRGNVCARYPSHKMGVIIQAESHKVELAAIYMMEYDADTLEYYDQPTPFNLEYFSKGGKPVGILHTPDFFVLRSNEAGWEEWKTEEDLQKLAETMPNRYQRDEGRRWRCPPGEHYAAQFGFFYRVRSSSEIDWVFQSNVRFLEDYLREDCLLISESVCQAIIERVRHEPGILLLDLLEAPDTFTSDDIYTLIAQGKIYVDWRANRLAEPDQVHVYGDASTAQAYRLIAQTPATIDAPAYVQMEAGTTILWDGQACKIANIGQTAILLLNDQGKAVELPLATFEALIREGKVTGSKMEIPPSVSEEARQWLNGASQEDFEEGNRRRRAIEGILVGHSSSAQTDVPSRTARDWAERYRKAEREHHCGYAGLLPRHNQKGNRQSRLPEATRQLMNQVIDSHYKNPKQKRKIAVYGELARVCEQRGLHCPSFKTFLHAIKRLPSYETEKARKGKRAAYQYKELYRELSLTTPRHGERPFEIVHIDHTELDIELVSQHSGHNLGRPWGTFVTDAFTRRLLVVYLSFDPPSYRSCMMAIRLLVRRYGRMPAAIVVDGGPEFRSVYFETLLARYDCIKKTRPGAEPRFGSVCERLFGTSNTQFVHNLLGNTQITKNVRQVTKSVDPKRKAVWTLGLFYQALCKWAYEIYDTIEHPALGMSPQEAFATGIALSGQRLQLLIPYDSDFLMFTLPTTATGKAKVRPGMGVKINYIYYWAAEMRSRAIENTRLEVRYDPFDTGTAYAYIDGRWVKCISQYYSILSRRTEREIRLATEEIRKQKRDHAKNMTITAKKIADFIASLENQEVQMVQHLRDQENRDALEFIEGRPVGLAMLASSATQEYSNGASEEKGSPSRPQDAEEEHNNTYGDF